jgi:ribosomal protein L37AE/L43A
MEKPLEGTMVNREDMINDKFSQKTRVERKTRVWRCPGCGIECAPGQYCGECACEEDGI